MRKIVINTEFGGFSLSTAAQEKLGVTTAYPDIERDDPKLVQVVEELGGEAGGLYSSLKVVEIPDDVEWGIHEYDGLEHIEEQHRTWS